MKTINFVKVEDVEKAFLNEASTLIKMNSNNDIIHFNKFSSKIKALEERESTDRFLISHSNIWKRNLFNISEEHILHILK